MNCSISETTPIAAAASDGTRRRKVVKGESTATKLGPEERGDIWCVEGGWIGGQVLYIKANTVNSSIITT